MKPILHHGDCLDILKTMPADSVDSVVTDPPYGLTCEHPKNSPDKVVPGFMGMTWDHGVPGAEYWREVLRVAKPGAFMLAFGGTRTFHRLACAIEDAGWDIRDCIMWVYGNGMPKSLDVGKALDKAAGAKRKVIGKAADFALDGSRRKTDESHMRPHEEQGGHGYGDRWSADVTAPETDEAKKWDGWGTALKPAWEPILVCRKPLEGTVAQNILKHGAGAMNIDGCRIEHVTVGNGDLAHNPYLRTHINGGNGGNILSHEDERRVVIPNLAGRWPANLIHDGSQEVLGEFDKAGDRPSCNSPSGAKSESKYRPNQGEYQCQGPIYPGDSGSAARFFYCAKASQQDRDEFLEDMELKVSDPYAQHRGRRMPQGSKRIDGKPARMGKNNHPTVKPTRLMRYLCRLVTPPNVVEIVCLSCYNGNDEQPKGASNNDRSQEVKDMPELRESISQQTQGESVLLGSMPAPSQHDSEKHMPAMRKASKAGEGETLLAPMRSESTCEGKTSENLRTMRQDVSTDVGPRREGQVKAVLQFDMQSTMDGAQKEKTIHNKRARISPDIQAGACNGEQERVCDGASPCYGREVGQDVERSRSGSSHQRKQVGQQAGKSDGNAIQCSQPDAENKKVKYNPVSTLRREDSAEQRCPKCGGRMSKIEKPSIILDPFMGSGSTGKAAMLDNFGFVGIEKEAEYMEIARKRVREDPFS